MEKLKTLATRQAVWIMTGVDYTDRAWVKDTEVVYAQFEIHLRARHLWTIPFDNGLLVLDRCPGVLDFDGNLIVNMVETRYGNCLRVAKGPLWEIAKDFKVTFDIQQMKCYKSFSEFVGSRYG